MAFLCYVLSMLVLLTILVGSFLGGLNTIFGAWVGCRIAEWFLHKDVTLSFATGVMLLLSIVRHRHRKEDEEDKKKKFDRAKAFGDVVGGVFGRFVFFALTLFFAFVLHRILG